MDFRRCLLAVSIGFAVAGCGKDEIVFHPHSGPVAPDPAKQKPAPADDSGPPMTLTKAGDVDLSNYGVPIYPGARLDGDPNSAFKAGGKKQILVTLKAMGDIKEMTTWYRNHIKATAAYGSKDLGTVDGVTATGYHVMISIAKMDADAIIAVTIDESKPK